LLMVLTWCIPNGDVAATANDSYPVLYVVYNNVGKFWANLIAIVIGGAMWMCGASSITSMGRMWYAFARDNGMPGSSVIKKISPRYKTPVNSILITSALTVLLCIYAAAYSVITSISTIALYLAYVLPIFLNLRNRWSGQGEYVRPEDAPWNLGRFSPMINAIAIVWVIFITIIFSVPPNELVLWTMLGLIGFLVIYWLISAKHKFPGPAIERGSAQGETSLKSVA
jgi:amino acid transporter